MFKRGNNSPAKVLDNGDWIVNTDGDTVRYSYSKTGPYRKLQVRHSDGEIINDQSDTETMTVELLDGLEVVRGTDPTNATVLDYGGDLTISVDGNQTIKTLTNGSVLFDLTTDKSAGSEIEIVAESLADYPAESDRTTIQVVSQ